MFVNFCCSLIFGAEMPYGIDLLPQAGLDRQPSSFGPTASRIGPPGLRALA